MLKRNLKKYKLLYRGVLEISYDNSNGKKGYKLLENKKRSQINIVKINTFHQHMQNKKKGYYDSWLISSEKNCDLRSYEDRNKVLSTMYTETKIYCESEETIYDMFKNIVNNILFKNKNEVFHNIVRTREYMIAACKLSNEVRDYIDDMTDNYNNYNNL